MVESLCCGTVVTQCEKYTLIVWLNHISPGLKLTRTKEWVPFFFFICQTVYYQFFFFFFFLFPSCRSTPSASCLMTSGRSAHSGWTAKPAKENTIWCSLGYPFRSRSKYFSCCRHSAWTWNVEQFRFFFLSFLGYFSKVRLSWAITGPPVDREGQADEEVELVSFSAFFSFGYLNFGGKIRPKRLKVV